MHRLRLGDAVVAAVSCLGIVACGGSTPSAPTPIPPAPTPTAAPASPANGSLTACGTIAVPGAYSLAADIGPTSALTCLRVAVSNVVLDCVSHTIGGYIALTDGVSGVTVRNCTMTGMANSFLISNVTISHSTMSNIVVIDSGTNVTLDHNTITLTGGRPAGAVVVVSGSGNQVISNVIDGGYHGQDLGGGGTDAPGADDGIILGDVRSDTVSGNTISNVFDAGIEGVNGVTGTTIANNTITHAVFAGISSYHCTAWQGNMVTGNVISQSQIAIEAFVSIDSLCRSYPNPPSAGSFTNNVIANNVLRNPLAGSPFGLSLLFNGPGSSATGNVVQGNDFGSGGISMFPPGGFSDGGGNTCGPQGNLSC